MFTTILASVYVTAQAALAFYGVCTLSDKVKAVKFERIEKDGSFKFKGENTIKIAAERIATLSNRVRSFILATNDEEDVIIVRYVK